MGLIETKLDRVRAGISIVHGKLGAYILSPNKEQRHLHEIMHEMDKLKAEINEIIGEDHKIKEHLLRVEREL